MQKYLVEYYTASGKTLKRTLTYAMSADAAARDVSARYKFPCERIVSTRAVKLYK